MVLDIIGRELLKDNSYHHLVKSPEILDNILSFNPSIMSFGLVTPEGKMTFTGSNLDTTLLPNLKEQEVSKDSFNRTLMSDKMVLGRSYFYKPLKNWVIPIRKAIRDPQGNVLMVMTAGLRLNLVSDILKINVNNIVLIRDQDRYIQFQHSIQEDFEQIYNTPISQEIFDQIKRDFSEKSNLSIQTLKDREEIYSFETTHIDKHFAQAVVKYNKRYELWTFSHVDKSQIFSEFITDFLLLLIIFIFSQAILYLLFRYIAHAEKQRSEDLIFQATHDALTTLPNRFYLHKHIHQWIYDGSPPFSLFYIDMDHFKNVNDTYGHQFGDELLKELAKRLILLSQDGSIVVRQGGDEFLIFSYCTDDELLLDKAQKIIDSLSKPYTIREFSFEIGASIGIAKYPEHGETIDMLLLAADIAMYESKKYKNSAYLFADIMQEQYLKKVVIEQELRKSLNNASLYMVYQLQFDEKGTPYGVEALVRWEDEKLGFVSPIQFIPIAESSGLMPFLGKFILRSSLHEIKQLQDIIGRLLHISINISVRQFMETTFLENLQKEVNEIGLCTKSITLEITENLFIEDINYILPLLKKIRDMGIHLSMDDFGTGYSSLSMLRKLPIDELKIDKVFVDTITSDETSKKMIQNIIAIGKNLEISVLAEGVETKEQEMVLKSFGCDHFQGYYYAKPMNYETLKAFFLSH